MTFSKRIPLTRIISKATLKMTSLPKLKGMNLTINRSNQNADLHSNLKLIRLKIMFNMTTWAFGIASRKKTMNKISLKRIPTKNLLIILSQLWWRQALQRQVRSALKPIFLGLIKVLKLHAKLRSATIKVSISIAAQHAIGIALTKTNASC